MASQTALAQKRRVSPRKKAQLSAAPKIERKNESWLDEILSVIFFSLALFLLTSFLSYKWHAWEADSIYGDVSFSATQWNLMGPVGNLVATIMAGFLGWCALFVVAWCGWFSLYFWNFENPKREKQRSLWVVLLGLAGVVFFSSTLLSLLGGRLLGGSLGLLIGEPLEHLFSLPGASLIAALFLLLCVALATKSSLAETTVSLWNWTIRTLKFACLTVPFTIFRAVFAVLYTFYAIMRAFFGMFTSKGEGRVVEEVLPPPRRRRVLPQPFVVGEKSEEEPQKNDERVYDVIVNRRSNEKKAEILAAKEKARKDEKLRVEGLIRAEYIPPAVELLTRAEVQVESENDDELRQKSLLIESKLRDFNIAGRVTHVHPGPVITLFEFEPAPGVKVGRIAALQEDLAMGLRATSIRIIAPIPRRGTVGIEVPNKHRDIVRLRDLLESEAFNTAESILSVPLGKDTAGEPVVADIAVMPHLLMAGATGTGKSVCINAVLLSLLYRAKPSELGLILIDPKILELSVYEDIPHLRVPVVVAPRQARAVLQWAVNEMNRRYRLMQRFGVRNIDGYNRVVSGEEAPPPPPPDVVPLGEDAVLEEGLEAGSDEDSAEDPAAKGPVEEMVPLPKIVIVIDELADLMLTVGREIEELITRLAQKARASGIHLIVATQRPSVDVITGLIKANFPARLSFRVSSRIDSRTILDSGGAERLLGRGDILFMQPGAEALKRIHGAFVSDQEVKRVVEAIKKNGKPHYDEHIMRLCEKALEEDASAQDGASPAEGGAMEFDPLYDKAVEIVVAKGQASTSMVQRVFRIGYNRAARIVEMMEREGVIGPMDGVKPREVLVPSRSSEEG